MNGCAPLTAMVGLVYGVPMFLAIPPTFTKFFKDKIRLSSISLDFRFFFAYTSPIGVRRKKEPP